MKKLISILLVLSCTGAFAACGNDIKQNQPAQNQPVQNQTQTTQSSSESPSSEAQEPAELPKPSAEKLGTFQKNATLEETVMVEENGVKITATGLRYNNHDVELELVMENNSGKDLSFISGSAGYSCNSVNGCMVNEGYLNCDVANGKKASDTIRFGYDALMLYGIYEIADMEIGFDISDKDFNHTYSGPRQIKTSAFEAHDYDKNHYQDAITSGAVMNSFGYEIAHFSKDSLYEESGIKHLSSGLMVNRDGDTALLLELENTTDEMVYLSTSDIVLNGLVVNSSPWSNDAINPGKRGIVDINLSSVLDKSFREAYGIKTVGSVGLTLTQRNADGNHITDGTPLQIVVPNTKAEYNKSGTEIYNANGLRLVSKTVQADSSEYSDDMYVLLLAENNSGKTLSIDVGYDSLSVNGFMTDFSCYRKEMKDGASAALDIKLWESSLKKNKISSVTDVKEVEMEFEIKEEQNTVDQPVVKISYE